MDISAMLEQIKGHVNFVTVALLVLFITSEIMGSNDKIKASSWYGIVKALLVTIKDQIWPNQVALPTPTAPATPAPTTPPAA